VTPNRCVTSLRACRCASPTTPDPDRKPRAAKSSTASSTAEVSCAEFPANAGMTCGAPLVNRKVVPSAAVWRQPLLVANAPAAILNIASVLSWLHPASTGAYNAAKTALWAQTDSVREELASQGVTVTALHVGYMDTDMISELSVAKNDPALIAAAALDGVASAAHEVLADDLTRQIRASLGHDQKHLASS